MSYDDDDDYLCHVVQTVEDVFARFFRLDFRLLLVFFGRLKAQSYVYVYIHVHVHTTCNVTYRLHTCKFKHVHMYVYISSTSVVHSYTHVPGGIDMALI